MMLKAVCTPLDPALHWHCPGTIERVSSVSQNRTLATVVVPACSRSINTANDFSPPKPLQPHSRSLYFTSGLLKHLAGLCARYQESYKPPTNKQFSLLGEHPESICTRAHVIDCRSVFEPFRPQCGFAQDTLP